jgi:tyrosine-protein kinase Etk/Wzc
MSQTANTEDTIDLKELFFSLIAQWKMITLCVLLSIVCALLYLRTTPDTYAVDALVQVEDSKGASAALLGDLSSMIEQKSPAQAEIEILKSRLVLGSVIDHLNLNIRVSGTEDSFWNRLIAKHEYDSEYSSQSVLFKDNQKSFDIRQFDIPQYFQDKNLILKFAQGKYSLTDAATEQVVFSAPLNQVSQLQSEFGSRQLQLSL